MKLCFVDEHDDYRGSDEDMLSQYRVAYYADKYQ